MNVPLKHTVTFPTASNTCLVQMAAGMAISDCDLWATIGVLFMGENICWRLRN